MWIFIIIVVLFLIAIFWIPGDKKTSEGGSDIKAVFEHIREESAKGKYFPYVNHEHDGGTAAYMEVCGISELSSWRKDIVNALALNEPLFLHRHSRHSSRIDVVTPKGIIIGWIPKDYSDILIHHMDSYFDCYVDKFAYDSLTVRAYFTDRITPPEDETKKGDEESGC